MSKRQHKIVDEIMTSGCIQLVDGKRLGTLLGELLSLISERDKRIEELEAELSKQKTATEIAQKAQDLHIEDLESEVGQIARDRLTILKRAETAEETEKGFVRTINRMSKRIKKLEKVRKWKQDQRALIGVRVQGKKFIAPVDHVIRAFCDELDALLDD